MGNSVMGNPMMGGPMMGSPTIGGNSRPLSLSAEAQRAGRAQTGKARLRWSTPSECRDQAWGPRRLMHAGAAFCDPRHWIYWQAKSLRFPAEEQKRSRTP